ncbi:ABC transporter permease subunit [bacterium]|nr:ABC transporter permease subunit [bacterium]
MSLTPARVKIGRTFSLVDVFLLLGLAVVIYAVVAVAQEWNSPYTPTTEIHLDYPSLFKYAFFSLVRVFLAYLISLVFTLGYGYLAAKSRIAEPILIPLLDILQSVPVLGFMPGLVLALVGLFPNSNLGLELAVILMIFTGEGWNMVFSFYSSLKTVPSDLRDMGALYKLNKVEMLRKVELPYAANGLLWNSMLSMAGGWFFLMVIESFSLGDKDFRLAGIGSYMAVAYEQNDMGAILAGIGTMFVLIAVVDRCIWAPLVVWSERFKMDSDPSIQPQRSVVLEWLKKSRLLSAVDEYSRRLQVAVKKRAGQVMEPVMRPQVRQLRSSLPFILKAVLVLLGIGAFLYGIRIMGELLVATPVHTWLLFIRDVGLTFVRVSVAVVLGSLWTIPVGVWIGTNPKWTRRMQPVVQVVASFPAPMLFPILTSALIAMGVSLEFGAVVLMLFASQWYILFNVIAGATQIPRQVLDVARVFRIGGLHYWRAVILPAIFPSLVNGWISAAGGAWNACIVSEIVTHGANTYVATGIGSAITLAAQEGRFPVLAGAILMMVTTVVLLNRFFWGSLYRLAETKYRFEG